MSGQHHRSRTGWVYGSRPRGTCNGCDQPRTVDTKGLVVSHPDPRAPIHGCPGSRRPPQEATMTAPTPGPDSLGAQDECATCSHARWRHREIDGQQVCTEYAGCACRGVFVELSPSTRMARFVEASQSVARSISTLRDALQDTMRATHALHGAMQGAGLIPELDQVGLCDGCDRTDQPVTATDDGRAQLCASCMQALNKPDLAFEANHPPEQVPALQQLTTWHRIDCDKTCGGTCTQWPNLHVQQQDFGPAPAVSPIIPGKWYREHTAQQLIDEHALRGIPVPGGADVPALADSLNADDRRREGSTNPASSCATCWPRPCVTPPRSECRRSTGLLQRHVAEPNADTHCIECGHPWEYAETGTCSMPVIPGTHTPIVAGQEGQPCGCQVHKITLAYPHLTPRTQDDLQGPVPDSEQESP